MRIAVVSDIHGNRTAFEAVLADLRETAPDLILHGGDLAGGGSSQLDIVDRIQDLGWQGVVGNTDEMLFHPASLTDFAAHSPDLASLFAAIEEMAAFSREALGEDRLQWLASLPRVQVHGPMTIVHASPDSTWRSPVSSASDAELHAIYGALGASLVVYGHIHTPYIRTVPGMVVANSGSVGLPCDGDRRAAYLLLDDLTPSIRRVAYDVDKELNALSASRLPHADWIAKTLAAALPQAL